MFVPHTPPRTASNDTPLGSAMLVRLTTTKQQDVWVNPLHVRLVRWSGKHTEVVIDPMYLTLKIAAPVEDVAALLDAASMPPGGFAPDASTPASD